MKSPNEASGPQGADKRVMTGAVRFRMVITTPHRYESPSSMDAGESATGKPPALIPARVLLNASTRGGLQQELVQLLRDPKTDLIALYRRIERRVC